MRANAPFERTLADAVSLLKELPRHRRAERTARSRFRRFQASHPDIAARLLTDRRPASDAIDYDILLSPSEGGTVALTWHADEDLPWTTLFSDHWAANLVLTVNGVETTIQAALIYLNAVLKRSPNLMDDLVNRSLIYAAMTELPLDLDDREIDKAVKNFRIGQGLSSVAATQRWLDEMQLTMEALRDLVAQGLETRKFKDSLVAKRVRPYFDAHRRDFDRVVVMRLEALTLAAARLAAASWRRAGTCPAVGGKHLPSPNPEGRLETLFARDLQPEFAGKQVQAVVGPAPDGSGFWVGQVLKRTPARLDRVVRDRIEALLFDEWLTEQKSKASVRWHWI